MSTPRQTHRPMTLSTRGAAIIAGIGYVVLFVLAIFANFFVREGLVVADDAIATFENIAQSEFLFRAGIAAFLVIFLVDVVVAWALHIVFRTVDRMTSLLAAWFRIVYTVFLGVAVVFLLAAVQLVGDSPVLAGLSPDQLATPVTLLMDAFNATWLIGLTAFGIHLAILGVMILRSAIASNILGGLLVAAGAVYVLDTFAQALLTDYANYAGVILAIVATVAITAEFTFMTWLLRRGGKDVSAPRSADVLGGSEPSSDRDQALV